MALRNILEYPHDTLSKKSKDVAEITPRIRELVQDMMETMENVNGVGLAAPQVGVLKRVIVLDGGKNPPIALINPVILEQNGEQAEAESCLSVPGRSGIVDRPQWVRVRGLGLDGKEHTYNGEGLFARAVCHEIDHLNGTVFVEVMKEEIMLEDCEGGEGHDCDCGHEH